MAEIIPIEPGRVMSLRKPNVKMIIIFLTGSGYRTGDFLQVVFLLINHRIITPFIRNTNLTI